MKPTILVDVDGILVDWFSRFPYFLESKGLPNEKAILMYAHGHWQSIEDLTGLPTVEATALVEEYSQSKYMKHLTPYKDALIAVNHLKKWFDFVAITAISNSDATRQYRRENLEFWFPGAIKDLHCVGIDGDKQSILSRYDPTIWIDDSPGYITEGLRAGHTCIRIMRDSRMNQVPSLIAKDWQEASNLILQHWHKTTKGY